MKEMLDAPVQADLEGWVEYALVRNPYLSGEDARLVVNEAVGELERM